MVKWPLIECGPIRLIIHNLGDGNTGKYITTSRLSSRSDHAGRGVMPTPVHPVMSDLQLRSNETTTTVCLTLEP